MEEALKYDEPVIGSSKVGEPVASKSVTPPLPFDFTKHLLGEAIVLASVTVVAYLLAYVYEIAYCNALGIPTGCIEIDTMQMIHAISITAIFFIVIFTAVLPFSMKLHQMDPKVEKCVTLCLLLCFLLAPFLAPTLVSHPYTPLIIVACITLFFPWGLNVHRAIRGQLMMMFLIIFLLAGALGEYSAKGQTIFLAQADKPEWVVLRRYGDVLVMGKVDGAKLTGEIRFEKYAEGGLTFKKVQTGSLVPQ